MRAKEIIKRLGACSIACNFEDFEVKGISCNSKEVSENFIFVAIEGARADGHRFIDEAVGRGAKVVIVTKSPPQAGPPSAEPGHQVTGKGKAALIPVEDTRRALAELARDFYGNPSSKIKVVGVTGTNGKTTITYLIEALLKESAFSPAVIGTVNYRFKGKLFPSKNTTPGPVELQSLLADMLKDNISHAVMEVSSHALSQNRTHGINFHSAIFTNLTQDHLDYHITMEDYFQAKAKLFKEMSAGSFAVVNNDDKYGRRLAELIRGPGIITYGIENKADVIASDIKLASAQTEFTLIADKIKLPFTTKLIGRHNIYNILASFAWALKEGHNPAAVKLALARFDSIPGRLERINSGKDFSVFVDYAHTEDALSNVIGALRQVSSHKIIVVFGCGGERDKGKRPKMGRVASELADFAIITNDNPRSEEPEKIIEDIVTGIRRKNYRVIPERREAIKESLSMAGTGDIVLIAGKGHENYQILKDQTVHFDDREAASECLESMN